MSHVYQTAQEEILPSRILISKEYYLTMIWKVHADPVEGPSLLLLKMTASKINKYNVTFTFRNYECKSNKKSLRITVHRFILRHRPTFFMPGDGITEATWLLPSYYLYKSWNWWPIYHKWWGAICHTQYLLGHNEKSDLSFPCSRSLQLFHWKCHGQTSIPYQWMTL